MKKTLLSLSAIALISNLAFADTDSDIADLKQQIADLQAGQQTLVDETSNIKTGFDTVDTDFAHNGMGAAASKVYTSKSPLSIGGYGDMYYASSDKKGSDAISDVYHFVPYIGYKFTDNIILNTEIEFEHGGSNAEEAIGVGSEKAEGYAIVEFMYLDFLINESFNVQLGHLLLPMGLINLRHEPTLYNSVQKPLTEKYIIPATWHATGVNTYGTIGDTGLSYNAGITQALDLNNGDKGSKGQVRSGRPGSTGKTVFNKAAFVGRLDYTGVNGLMVGASMYYGDATQGSVSDSTALIYDLHATYENSGFKVKALYGATSISNAENIAANLDYTGTESISDSNGYYVNFEYDTLATFGTTQKLPLFVQYDYINPTATVINNLGTSSSSDVGETKTTTFGINYFPHEQVVLKMDYAMTDVVAAGQTDYNTISLGLGFIF